MKQLTIAVGPQGSGNHLYAKLFGSNKNIYGWQSLQEKYWEGHDMEPFSDYWQNPEFLLDFDTSTHDYFYTSMGCPYVFDGETLIPDFETYHYYAAQVFDNVNYIIIGRDKNILRHQQSRVRNNITFPKLIKELDFFLTKSHVFVSQELIYLYGIKYLNSIEDSLDIPRNNNIDKINEILIEDQNYKYMQYVEYTELDDLVKLASKERGGL